MDQRLRLGCYSSHAFVVMAISRCSFRNAWFWIFGGRIPFSAAGSKSSTDIVKLYLRSIHGFYIQPYALEIAFKQDHGSAKQGD